MLLHAHGERILRVKGILDAKGSDTPVVIHAVQHLVHQLEHLSAWPTQDPKSRLVFIIRDMDPKMIIRSFNAFCRQGEDPIP
jgi:G3E family GTPase